MVSRLAAISVPARRTLNADRIILAAAAAFALLSILVAWQTFAPRASTGSAIDQLEAARSVPSLAQSPHR
ncbi:MAG: hypothetical protein HYY34_08195 [Chloroflexi bacterium]|nr:hypothetical protein [Chloroflexota bacterium]